MYINYKPFLCRMYLRVRKYNISATLSIENPMKRPRRPPQFARKSVCPYSSERLDVINCASLKKIITRA